VIADKDGSINQFKIYERRGLTLENCLVTSSTTVGQNQNIKLDTYPYGCSTYADDRLHEIFINASRVFLYDLVQRVLSTRLYTWLSKEILGKISKCCTILN